MSLKRTLAAFATLLTVGMQPANAAVLTFTDRATWEVALAGPVGFLEDFGGFLTDTSFRTTTVDVGPFTLAQTGSRDFRNFIDVAPFLFAENDGTTYASMFTDFGATTVTMGFADALYGWGADFSTIDAEGLSLDLMSGATLIATINPPAGSGFFGFITVPSEAIDSILFRSQTNSPGLGGEGFGLDDVAGAQAEAVPEPSTALLVGLGLVGLGVASRRKL